MAKSRPYASRAHELGRAWGQVGAPGTDAEGKREKGDWEMNADNASVHHVR